MNAGALDGKLVCSTIKGIIPDENMIVGEYLREVVGVPENHIVVITGPCHAEEIALERLSFLTVAAIDASASKKVASVLQSHYVRCTLSTDIYGTEYAAVMKNIYAIAAGMCHGLGYGDNFQAVCRIVRVGGGQFQANEVQITVAVQIHKLRVGQSNCFSRLNCQPKRIGLNGCKILSICLNSACAQKQQAPQRSFDGTC